MEQKEKKKKDISTTQLVILSALVIIAVGCISYLINTNNDLPVVEIAETETEELTNESEIEETNTTILDIIWFVATTYFMVSVVAVNAGILLSVKKSVFATVWTKFACPEFFGYGVYKK